MTIQELINKHIDQIRKDFDVPANYKMKDANRWTGDTAKIIGLPETIYGMGQPYLVVEKPFDGNPDAINVVLRIAITPRSKSLEPIHNILLESKTY